MKRQTSVIITGYVKYLFKFENENGMFILEFYHFENKK